MPTKYIFEPWTAPLAVQQAAGCGVPALLLSLYVCHCSETSSRSQRTGGLLELVFPDRSRIVINTQPPLHELWLAPRAGGFHYRHVTGCWVDTRDGSDFFATLSREVSAQAGRTLVFAP